ncbi:MAG TPA: EAL domain-containing protein [Steroidobacteraceae bacterium]|nr:EAL domain-containing protein [Steroidobacteraceae bacterium]
MSSALKVLIIEDSPTDAEIAIASLRRTWPDIDWQRVESEEAFLQQLQWLPDIIIADYEVPGFGALAALRILRSRNNDIPLIVFTGAVTEEIVVQCIRHGAADYLLKDRMTRLGPAIENALNMRRDRLAKQRTERDQQRLAALNIALLDSLPAHVALLDKQGKIIATNEAWRRDGNRQGFTHPEWGVGTDYAAACLRLSSQHNLQAANIARGVHSVLNGSRPQFVQEYAVHGDDAKRWFRVMITPVHSDQHGGGAVVMHLNITDRRLAEEQLKINSNALQHLSEGVVITDANLRVITVNKAYTALTGFEPEEVLGLPLGTVITGEDNPNLHTNVTRTIAVTGSWLSELICRRRDAGQFPAIFSISPVRDEQGNIEHYTAVLTDLSSLRDVEQRIEYLAGHDVLTGLPNRSALETQLRTILTGASSSSLIALLLIELDRFKSINDTLGHRTGDAVIRAVSERLTHHKEPQDFVARLGGDEFVLVRSSATSTDDVLTYAETIRNALERPFVIANREFFITASIGISCFPRDGTDAESLIRTADAAVYQAKERGRNAVALYSPTGDAAAAERFVLQNSLPQALKRNQFLLDYQPVVDLNTGKITGVEALLRWHHPQLGLISPARFISIAEETGLILPISDWVLNTACAQLHRWQQLGWHEPNVAVNLSTREFSRGDLSKRVADALSKHDLKPRQLTLELTESMVMGDPVSAAELINDLAEMGVKVALDDFGTGYSSLSYLKRFRLGCLKVDRSFVSGAAHSIGDQSIVRAVIALGKTLDMKIIAEGVETLEQANFLRQSGCDDAQGYFYSQPVSPDMIPDLVRDIPQRFHSPSPAHWYSAQFAEGDG